MGVLSWLIERGDADGIDLGGLPVARACRYSDDEPGSPWTWILYLDAESSAEQRAALEDIFTGRLGGDAERHFPWAWKTSELVAGGQARSSPTIRGVASDFAFAIKLESESAIATTVMRRSPASYRGMSEQARSSSRTNSLSTTTRCHSHTAGCAGTDRRSTIRARTGLRLSSRTKPEPTSSPFAHIDRLPK
jgi:hypothetical protein